MVNCVVEDALSTIEVFGVVEDKIDTNVEERMLWVLYDGDVN